MIVTLDVYLFSVKFCGEIDIDAMFVFFFDSGKNCLVTSITMPINFWMIISIIINCCIDEKPKDGVYFFMFFISFLHPTNMQKGYTINLNVLFAISEMYS